MRRAAPGDGRQASTGRRRSGPSGFPSPAGDLRELRFHSLSLCRALKSRLQLAGGWRVLEVVKLGLSWFWPNRARVERKQAEGDRFLQNGQPAFMRGKADNDRRYIVEFGGAIKRL